MKTALCYAGQIGAFHQSLGAQSQSFLDDCDDIYAYTSHLVTHKGLNYYNAKEETHCNIFQPVSKVYKYLEGYKGWRKNIDGYGVIYQIDKKTIWQCLSPLIEKIKCLYIEEENLEECLDDLNMSKWEWMKKRQFHKMYQSNELIKKSEENYDIVIRCRFDLSPLIKVEIKKIFEEEGDDNTVFVFGGFGCTPPMVFMDEYICDGFAFGSPRVMDIFSSLYLKEDPYPYNPKYKDCWEKWGDNAEYQVRTHLETNGVKIKYIGNKRSMYHVFR
jgi:hypothetical protein